MATIPVTYPEDWTDYELLDSGDTGKLERFAGYVIARPDPRAIWKRGLPDATWQNADAIFERTSAESGTWVTHRNPPDPWRLTYNGMTFSLRPTDFKHVGVFPEQAANWTWLANTIAGRPLKVLNLFGYSGAATVAMAKAGAHVTHVDSSKSAITWANEHIAMNGLANAGTRWILEDAVKFVSREQSRGNTYDGVVMDPPRFGRGTKGEVWKLAEDLPRLLSLVRTILSPTPSFLLVNAYTADLSSIAVGNLLTDTMRGLPGSVWSGELAVKESARERFLPHGSIARWSARV